MPIYSDIPYDLSIDEFGDLELIEDAASIRQSLQTIVLTKIGTKTKFQNPIFGSATAELLFEKMNPFTISNLEEEVLFAIENWEPRVEIDAVEIITEKHQVKASIRYTIVSLNITESITINLSVLS
jgi:phage baseplate assembly protein W